MVNIDHSRDSLLSDFAIRTLKANYLLPDEKPQEGFARAAQAYATDEAHAQRIYDYASRHWFMFSTPILSNAGRKDGLPISCYLNHVEDSREGILGHYTENGWLSSNGGGIGADWSYLRPDGSKTSKGGKSTGIIPFLKMADSATLAFSQGTSRRGSYAAYLDISHPEIEEFITMRKPSGGDFRRKCLDIDHGVNIPDDFMRCVITNADYALADPNSGKVKKIVKARYLWELILQTRMETGEPYIHFIDASNRVMASGQKDKGLRIRHSNLCTEILLPTGPDRTAVCCLASVNLTYYDQWKDTQMVGDLVEYLDNVLTYFEQNAPEQFWRAKESIRQERALGLGDMGFHDYLQKHNIAFGSEEASRFNIEAHKHYYQLADKKSRELAITRGECPEYPGRRHAYLLAIAPNASSSIICGNTSPGIEPYRANCFTQKTNVGSNFFRNSNLKINEDQWDTVRQMKGSVKHHRLPNGDVFKTAIELNQMDIIKHAAERQPYICQGQSVNLFFKADADRAYINRVHLEAWKQGLKTLYYVRSESPRHVESVTQTQSEVNDIKCIGCE
jgi:ribonucleoside-diphosphate reductase alpha chain